MSKTEVKMRENWEAESDLRTLIEAKAIQDDPKRLKAALALAKEKRQSIVEVIGETSGNEEED